ncbi:MAG TPA: P1 family peptidase [Candidatus Tyrphobacter sp.]
MPKPLLFTLTAALLLAPVAAGASLPFRFGAFPSGPFDGITDVPGVRVGHVTKVEGANIRTGATAVLPNADPWDRKVAAATIAFNGNGEMTGTHWIAESGYLEEPIVLTDTLDVGRADDGVVSWQIARHPEIGRSDDVPLPVVAECDDQLLDDIQARAVSAADVVHLLDSTTPGQFARGSVGAGTGMRAFDFKGGIGSASRVLPASLGGYTVGVLVNDNTGSTREQLTILGVPAGERLKDVDRTTFPHSMTMRGRMASGSIVVVIATDAPLEARQLRALALRAALGMGRTGLTSDVGSGDLFIAFSTTRVYQHSGHFEVTAPAGTVLSDSDRLDALYRATAEATQAAIYDALFEATTMTGQRGVTVHALPRERVLEMLRAAGAIQ